MLRVLAVWPWALAGRGQWPPVYLWSSRDTQCPQWLPQQRKKAACGDPGGREQGSLGTQADGPGSREKLWGGSEFGSGALPTCQAHSSGPGPLPYLSGSIAMDEDREGVVSQVPRSHMAHFKLEHDLIWG